MPLQHNVLTSKDFLKNNKDSSEASGDASGSSGTPCSHIYAENKSPLLVFHHFIDPIFGTKQNKF